MRISTLNDYSHSIDLLNSDVNLKPKAVHLRNTVGKTNQNDRIDTCLSEFNRRLNDLMFY